MTDLLAVAREGASKSAMDSPLHQTLVALVDSGDVHTALAHLRSLHRTATADSWNLLLSHCAHIRRFTDVTELWQLWLSILPPVDAPLPAGQHSQLLPNATTYGLLLRSPPSDRLLTASEALQQLSARQQPASTFIYNTRLKELAYAKQYDAIPALLASMASDGVSQDVYTISMRFTVSVKTSKWLEPAARYAEVCALWDELVALQQHRLPPSLTFAFVWPICKANDSRRLVQLVQAIVSTSAPPDVAHQSRQVEAMLACLMRNDRLSEMIALYRYMRRVGFRMKDKHFFALVAGFARQGETNGMMRVFNEMVGHGIQPGHIVFQTMLQAHGKVGDEEAAVRMLRRMSEFGVQPTIDSICAIARGIYERSCEQRSEAEVVADEAAAVSDESGQTAATSVFSPPSLSLEYLHLFELTDEFNMTPAAYMYHRLLEALRKENDLGAILFFLHDMKSKGVGLCLSSLQWVLWQLSLLTAASPHSAHVRLMIMRASLIVEGEEGSLGGLSMFYLLSVHVGVGDVAAIMRVYHAIHERQIRISRDIYQRMMAQVLQADDSDVREHERMHFLVTVYSHLRASERQFFGETTYNEVLQAYAVLGDTAGMKEVLQAMRKDGVAMGEATVAVLDEAREHVEYTADIASYVAQQRSRITTLRMEDNMRQRQKAESSEAAVSATGKRTSMAAIDAPMEKGAAQALFTLPEWSPLYDQTALAREAEEREEAIAAAQVAEVQSMLSALLSTPPTPVVHAQHFPPLVAASTPQSTEAAAGGSHAKRLSAINRKVRAVAQTWPAATQTPPLTAALSPAPSSLLVPVPLPGHIDLSARTVGTVKRVTRRGTIGWLPPFSSATIGTAATARSRVLLARKAEDSRKLAEVASTLSARDAAPRSPALPLPAASAFSSFFRAIDSHSEALTIADGNRRKRRTRKAAAV